MLHSEVLKLLFPVDLGGVFDDDIAVEGAALDRAQERAYDLLREIFPAGSHELLNRWERVCGLSPSDDAALQSRQADVVRKLREQGGLSRAYFVALAAAIGYTIEIEELLPFMAGWGRCGDATYVEDARWIWVVTVTNQSLYYFRAGMSVAGERLLWWPAQTILENIFNDLKPAHTYIVFAYS